jgi:hypothetical protein
VNIESPPYFQRLFPLLRWVPIETVRSYALWRVLHRYAASLSRAFRDEHFDFWGRFLRGQSAPSARNKLCSATVTALLPELVGRYYVERVFQQNARDKSLRMIGQLKEVRRHGCNVLVAGTVPLTNVCARDCAALVVEPRNITGRMDGCGHTKRRARQTQRSPRKNRVSRALPP